MWGYTRYLILVAAVRAKCISPAQVRQPVLYYCDTTSCKCQNYTTVYHFNVMYQCNADNLSSIHLSGLKESCLSVIMDKVEVVQTDSSSTSMDDHLTLARYSYLPLLKTFSAFFFAHPIAQVFIASNPRN